MSSISHVEYAIGEHAQHQIIAGNDGEAALAVCEAVLFFMACGYLPEGKKLLLQLWNSTLWNDAVAPQNALDCMLHFASDPSDDWELTNLEDIELEQREHLAHYRMDSFPGLNLPTQNLGPFERITQKVALHMRPVKFPTAQEELEALSELEEFIRNANQRGFPYDLAKAFALAAEIAAKHGETERATALLQQWATFPNAQWIYLHARHILAGVHVAPLLAKGILAESLGVPTVEVARTYLQGLENALETRLAKGRTLVYRALNIRQLLEKLSAIMLREEPERFNSEQHTTHWVGNPPATEAAIQEAETRLGMRLPDDYRAFLLESNGFPYPYWTAPELVPIEQVDFLRNIYPPEFMEVLLEYPADIPQHLEHSIKIGSEIESSEILLLIPLPANNWACWFFAHWVPGEVRYPDFRAYLEHLIHQAPLMGS